MSNLIRELQDVLGADAVVTGAALAERATSYWDSSPMQARALLRPNSTEAVSQAMHLCHKHGQSVDHNLLNLFELYGANRWQSLYLLRLPAALPYFLTGLRIGGGLALIAAVVAEFAAGSAGAGSGLAFRLLESQFRLNIPRLFAALILLSVTGVLIFFATSLISHLLLHKWHESAVKREN